jgi:hypothetical protein
MSLYRNYIYIYDKFHMGASGGAVVEALRYKPEGRGIDFSFT